jgi:putative ABC transport system ATP-binding protein
VKTPSPLDASHLQPPRLATDPGSGPGSGALIDVRDLVKVYDVGDVKVRALDGVTVAIARTEFLAVMGPSGSGKSTFMNLLGCLDRPTSGRYLLDGQDVSRLDRDRLAEIRNGKLGFVFQGFNLLPRATAVENVELPMLYDGVPPREREGRATEALRSVGLAGREGHHPNQLSGGEQQRVAIARALVKGAPIILADEPTGNLDTKTSIEIMELFVKLNEESRITLVLVTHEPDIAAYAQRIIRFRDGRLVGDERAAGSLGERTSQAWTREASR